MKIGDHYLEPRLTRGTSPVSLVATCFAFALFVPLVSSNPALALLAMPLVVMRRVEVRWTKVVRLTPITPSLVIAGSVLLVYIVPLAAALGGYSDHLFLPSRLSRDELNTLQRALIVGVAAMGVGAAFIGLILRRRSALGPAVPQISLGTVRAMVALTVAVWIIHLGMGVGFSPELMVDRMLNPRDYTELRAGAGVFVALRAVAFLATMVALAATHARGVSMWAPFVSVSILSVLGGNKTNIVLAPLIWVTVTSVIRRRNSVARVRLSPVHSIRTAAVVFASIVVAFAVMTAATENRGLRDRVATYQRESYFSAVVLRDYDPNLRLASELVTDAVLAGVPRALLETKAAVGFYGRYWQPRYEPNVVYYHASTYGFLAEAHMVAGMFGIALWGLVLGGAAVAIAIAFGRVRSLAGLAITSFWLQYLYFAVRGGFGGPTLLYIVVVVVGLRLWFVLFSVLESFVRASSPGPAYGFATVPARHRNSLGGEA